MSAMSTFQWVQVALGAVMAVLATGQLLGTWGYVLALGAAFITYSVFGILQDIKTLLVNQRERELVRMVEGER